MLSALLPALLVAAPVTAQTSAAGAAHAGHGAPAAAKPAKVSLVYRHELPNVPGKSVKGVLVEYEPGGANPSHVHAPSALIYATVLEGAVLNQINGGPVRTFRKGENFTELPGDFHNISANASATEPAKLLAVFIVDTADAALTTPATAPR
ncbi:MAG: cupin domain-containing protein [Sphingopyxis sp.]|nr:cupin domain-containing protein [Sphingopyxis sp.]